MIKDKSQSRPLIYHMPFTFYQACINNYIHHKVLGEITYPFPNFSGAAVQAGNE